jgi:hypothetical protein
MSGDNEGMGPRRNRVRDDEGETVTAERTAYQAPEQAWGEDNYPIPTEQEAMGLRPRAPLQRPNMKATRTVTVACKLPNGIQLRAYAWRDQVIPGSNGQTERVAYPYGESFTIKGNAVSFGMPTGHLQGGFSLTPGVPYELWMEWYRWNQDSDIVKNGLIFAHEDGAEITRTLRDKNNRDLVRAKTGLEPIDPKEPKKFGPPSWNAQVSAVQPGKGEADDNEE